MGLFDGQKFHGKKCCTENWKGTREGMVDDGPLCVLEVECSFVCI